MSDNYRLVEYVTSRVEEKRGSTTVLKPEDMVGKIEYNNGRESYYNGFTDYHKRGGQ